MSSLPKENEFAKHRIEIYEHWELFLYAKSQYYLGRTYLWARRKDAVDFLDMTNEERKDLFKVGKDVRRALNKSFNPDLLNYAVLANETQHLHIHIIPRYKFPRKFAGVRFKDNRWGKNYAPYNPNFKVSDEVLTKIQEELWQNIW